MFYYFKYKSPFFPLTLLSDGDNLIALYFDNQKNKVILNQNYEEKKLAVFETTIQWLDSYFAGEIPLIKPKIKFFANDFQQKVWQIVEKIPYGQTSNYGKIANEVAMLLGKKNMSPQAVGTAIGHNPIAIIIPCHRVILANGKIGNYAAGSEKKTILLNIEKNYSL